MNVGWQEAAADYTMNMVLGGSVIHSRGPGAPGGM